MSKVQGVIMAGGFGTRLRPLTCNIPKPMTPLLNKPIIEHNINLLKYNGIKDLILILYYQSEIISDYFGDGSRLGVKITYVKPDADYGTAGAVYCADKHIKNKFIVLSGDVVTDFDLTKAISFHVKKKSAATIILTRAENPLQFGIVMTDKYGKINRFFEKPTWSEVFSDTINTGIYILEKKVLSLVTKARGAKQDCDFSKDLYPYILKNKIPLYGVIAEGYWRDVGSLEDYISTNLDALSGKIKLANFDDSLNNGYIIGKGTKVSAGADVVNSVIGNNCRVDEGSVIKNSVIWNDAVIGKNVNISSAVLCNNIGVREKASISENVYIGDNVLIGSGASVRQGIKIWPNKIIDGNSIVMKSIIWEERWKDSLFTDSRITGLANIEVTSEFTAKLGLIFGVFIGRGKRITISRDTDDVARMIKGAIISGVMSAGVDVIDLQTTPVPILRQDLKSGKSSGGIFVRKSPNDTSKIDIIFFDSNGKDLSTAKTKSIERLFFAGDHAPTPYTEIGSVSYAERTYESYKDFFLSNIDIETINKKRFKIAINYSHGITSSVFPLILGNFNIEIVSMDTHLDTKRQNRSSKESKNALEKLSYVVTSLKYDAGFMLDAGGEKIDVVDDKGKIIAYDRFLSIMTKLYLGLYPKTKKIAVPIQASGEIDMIAKKYRTEIMRVKDSHFAMMNAADDPDVSFVGGTKGGVIFPDFLFATDGMYTIMKILEMLSLSKKSLSQINKETPVLFASKKNLFCTKEQKGEIMRRLVEETEGMKRHLIDGIKIFYDEYKWVLCIPDSEREIFHVNAEAKNQREADNLVKEYSEKILTYQQNI